jgi:tRNA-specific 2-thiouridylase
MSTKTVIVGMSGGVDSSVSALLLKQQGYRVIGLFMKNWEEKDEQGVCQSAKEFEDVARVCDQIGIPYYAVNFVKEYWDGVFAHFLDQYAKGLTPNPDILCNREIKFKALLDKALELGGDYLATGHYCQIRREGEEALLLKGEDPGKDQSYFLYSVQSDALKHALFPIGHLPKSDVRRIAQEHGLHVHEKKDSTGICFIGERHFRTFLSNYVAPKEGTFQTLAGKVVGKHQGAAYYTIGQRKGMGIGGAGEAWFVVGKDIEKNIVYVEQGTRHPALYADFLVAGELTWTSKPPQIPFKGLSKIRYRQPDQHCMIEQIEDGRARISFDVPQRAITPGQAIVFYQDNICLGGGTILSAGPSYDERQLPLPPVVSL